jgi:PTH1 family peptidyl-tRNA hydrolase
MWLIVGLGNPGAGYARHRHNVGFMAVDALAHEQRFSSYSKKFTAELADGMIADQRAVLLKPLTYMNHSGQSVGEACRFYKIAPEQVLVIHDDLDLVFGKIRIKQGGGHGGHNGLRDIDRHVGKDYWRIRFGIGHPGHKDRVHDYVLSDFTKAEQPDVALACAAIATHLPLFFSHSPEALMSKIAMAAPISNETSMMRETD